MEKDYSAARCAAGKGSADGAARVKGAILSRERMAPLDPQENARGGPLDPAIAGLQLEGLHALRSVGAVYMASP